MVENPAQEVFFPSRDLASNVSYRGDNVGDHLCAAAANVLGDGNQEVEQAIFADELSDESLVQAPFLMMQQWRNLALRLQELIGINHRVGRVQDQSLRIDLFTWPQAMPQVSPHPSP